MLQVNATSLNVLTPDEISDAMTQETANIDAVTLETLFLLVGKLVEALGGRKQLKRRVDALENIVKVQQEQIKVLYQAMP